MPKNNNTPVPNSEENNNSSFDLYNADKTKEIVGSLFDEFVEEGGTNYFADYSDPFLDSESEEDEESLKESISRRRRRNITTANKSIVFRKKTKKVKPEEPEPEEDSFDEDTPEEPAVQEPGDLEKTIILPKLSNFFKKSGENKEDEAEDDEIDEFFASLTKDSAARAQAAASKEDSEPVKTEEKPAANVAGHRPKKAQAEEADREPLPVRKPKQEFIEPVQEDNDDEYEEKLVEISLIRIITVAVLIIAVVVITALAYKNHSYAKQLEEARSQITELQKSSSSTYETELNELKNQVSELTAENESLKADSSSETDLHAAAVEILNEAQSEISSQDTPDTSLSQEESAGGTYTVQAGDTFWKISQNVYGNGANYQKILDANNLTENSILNEGQVLTIPN